MKILSHRGYWKTDAEKNTDVAFRRSFELGFGTETDIRDHKGQLVVSHDPPLGEEMTLEAFLMLYKSYDLKSALALNIKADGLQESLQTLLTEYDIQDYFVFDMSIPDTLGYLKRNMHTFTRMSDYELSPSCYEASTGIWIDCFESDWITESTIAPHLQAGKQVCLVSPDLHKRPYEAIWQRYLAMSCVNHPNLMLCTDFPEQARGLFESVAML